MILYIVAIPAVQYKRPDTQHDKHIVAYRNASRNAGVSTTIKSVDMCETFQYEAAVIGCGRFGMLWARLLSRYFNSLQQSFGPVIAVADTRPVLLRDMSGGARFLPLQTAVSDSRAVFLCVPISSLRGVLADIAPLLRETTVVLDTCSVKEFPVSWMKQTLSETQPIIATHPLFGPDSFVLDGEQNRHNTIITYPVRANDETYTRWLDIFSGMGLRPRTMSPREHDQQSAYTQALTHLLGRVLGSMNLKQQVVSTQGYEALLEIIEQTASDSSALFQDLQHHNAFCPRMRRELQSTIDSVLKQL